MTLTAISIFKEAEQVNLGTKKPVSVKNALNCVSHKNPIVNICHQVLCFLTGKGIITKKRLVKVLHEADLPTLSRVQALFAKAKKHAVEDTKITDAAKATEKKAANQFLSQAKNYQLFLDLLAEEFLIKFAANDPALLTLIKNLPAENKQGIRDLAKAGVTAAYVVECVRTNPQDSAVELLKPLLEKETFAKEFKADLDHKMNPNIHALPNLAELYEELNKGLFGVVQNGFKLPKAGHREFVKQVNFTIKDQTNNPTVETYFVAPKPTNPEDTAEIFKKALAEKSSHIVALSYPSYLAMKANTDHKLGNSFITLKLLSQKTICGNEFIVKNFQVTDASVIDDGKPLQRTIKVLVHLSLLENRCFEASIMNDFLDKDTEISEAQPDKKNPLIIGFDGLAFTGTYLTLRHLKPAGELPILETFHQVGKCIGASSLPRTAEEVISLFSTYKVKEAKKELSSLKSFKFEIAPEEFAKTLLKEIHPGTEPTPLQIQAALSELKFLEIDPTVSLPEPLFRTLCVMYQHKISGIGFDPSFLAELLKTYGLKKQDYMTFFPEVIEETVVEYKKILNAKATVLAKAIFVDLKGKDLDSKAQLLAKIIPDINDFKKLENPIYHEGLKELLNQNISVLDLQVMAQDYAKGDFFLQLSPEFQKQKADQAFSTAGMFKSCDPLKVLAHPNAFKEYLTALKAAKAKAATV